MALDPDSRLAQRLNPVIFLTPALLIYCVFAIYPTISVVEYSFTDWDGIAPERNFVGFENYQRLFSDKIFWEAFRNTFVWSAVIIVLNVGLGLVIAAMLARPVESSPDHPDGNRAARRDFPDGGRHHLAVDVPAHRCDQPDP